MIYYNQAKDAITNMYNESPGGMSSEAFILG
jgi:hypothetical protein